MPLSQLPATYQCGRENYESCEFPRIRSLPSVRDKSSFPSVRDKSSFPSVRDNNFARIRVIRSFFSYFADR